MKKDGKADKKGQISQVVKRRFKFLENPKIREKLRLFGDLVGNIKKEMIATK
jgi:hypothetical protein